MDVGAVAAYGATPVGDDKDAAHTEPGSTVARGVTRLLGALRHGEARAISELGTGAEIGKVKNALTILKSFKVPC